MEHIPESLLEWELSFQGLVHPFRDYEDKIYVGIWSLVEHAGLQTTDLYKQLVLREEIYSIGSCISFIFESEASQCYDWLQNVAKLNSYESWRFQNLLQSVARCRSFANFNELAVAAKAREAKTKGLLAGMQDRFKKLKSTRELFPFFYDHLAHQYNDLMGFIDEAATQLSYDTGDWLPRTPIFAANAYLMMCRM